MVYRYDFKNLKLFCRFVFSMPSKYLHLMLYYIDHRKAALILIYNRDRRRERIKINDIYRNDRQILQEIRS